MDTWAQNGHDVRLERGGEGVTALARAAGAVLAGERGFTRRPASVTEIPAGERRGIDIRGRGDAALADLGRTLSPEAALAALTARAADLPAVPAGCGSGRELAGAGHARDVALAAQGDVSTTAPVLDDRVLEAG